MAKTDFEQPADTQSRDRRISPELSEVLQMLNALEGHLLSKPSAKPTAR